MKILVVSQYYYPEDFRINDICEELVRRGNQVTVVTGIPNYPKGDVFDGYAESYKKPECVNGVTVIRCNNRPRKSGQIALLLNYLTYAKEASKVIKKLSPDFDVIYAYQLSPISLVLPAIKYKKMHGTPLYIYVCDVWPESVRDKGKGKLMSKWNPAYLFFKHLSKRIYTSADLIGVKCDAFTDYLEQTCKVKRDKCRLNYEHAEALYLTVNERPIDNGVIDLMYLGNLGHASDCDLIIKAASKLECGNYMIHFVGDGSEYKNLVSLSRALKIEDKIIFHGKVPKEEVINLYNLADVCLLTLSGKTFIGQTPPAKLTSYLAACRPILASANGASEEVIRAADCGFVVPAGDEEGLASLMKQAIKNPSKLYPCGKNGRNYFMSHFTIKEHVDVLEEHLNGLLRE